MRRSLPRKALNRKDLLANPFSQFAAWFKDAQRSGRFDQPEAMCVATIDPKGFPDARMVLLKSHGPKGFVFFTDTRSVKGRSLKRLPRVAITFFWDSLKRQVRIQGTVHLVSARAADHYFRTRPRLSQLGSWASHQSDPLPDRAILDAKVAELTETYKGKEIPRPPYWTGICIQPFRFEFWQSRENRLNDRFIYTRSNHGRWLIQRLYP